MYSREMMKTLLVMQNKVVQSKNIPLLCRWDGQRKDVVIAKTFSKRKKKGPPNRYISISA